MTDSLFQQLKRIGIDDELACQVSASLDPDHNASKKDVLILQEAILQVQARTDERYYQIKAELIREMTDLRTDLTREMASIRADTTREIASLRTDTAREMEGLRTDTTREMAALRADTTREIANSRIEYHNLRRHSIYAFGAMIVSIVTVLAVNIYFHL